MKFSILLLTLLLSFFIIVTECAHEKKNRGDKGNKEEMEDKEEVEEMEEMEEKDLGDTLQTVAAAVGHPEVSAAIEVIKSLRTESSSRIGEQRDQIAFKQVYNDYDHGSGAIHEDNFDKLVSLWLEDDIWISMPPHYKEVLARTLKEYAISLKDEAFHKEKYQLSFNDGHGHLIMMVLYLIPHPTLVGGIKWEKFLLKSSFVPAPSYVIVTESDCDLLSCDTTDQIVYLPTVLNAQHISAIVNMNLDILSGFAGHLRSLPSN